ncbi:MAG: hypothetical protein PHI68_04055, partial [Candidatus Cloacimonetes bacterium]|nr:hypothetical protein [Candidatus Cloacimonadota bacterium]
WNSNQDRKMNDLFASLNYSPGSSQYGLDYSHIEKLDDELLTWSLESTPALNLGIPIKGNNFTCKAEYKYAKKTLMDQSVEHYEPKLQVDYSLGRVALSAGAQSWWHSPKDLMDSTYWTNIEAKIKIYEHSDLTLFAGKEAGGKVCRNGTCRFVAPFEGYKVEISTRF